MTSILSASPASPPPPPPPPYVTRKDSFPLPSIKHIKNRWNNSSRSSAKLFTSSFSFTSSSSFAKRSSDLEFEIMSFDKQSLHWASNQFLIGIELSYECYLKEIKKEEERGLILQLQKALRLLLRYLTDFADRYGLKHFSVKLVLVIEEVFKLITLKNETEKEVEREREESFQETAQDAGEEEGQLPEPYLPISLSLTPSLALSVKSRAEEGVRWFTDIMDHFLDGSFRVSPSRLSRPGGEREWKGKERLHYSQSGTHIKSPVMSSGTLSASTPNIAAPSMPDESINKEKQEMVEIEITEGEIPVWKEEEGIVWSTGRGATFHLLQKLILQPRLSYSSFSSFKHLVEAFETNCCRCCAIEGVDSGLYNSVEELFTSAFLIEKERGSLPELLSEFEDLYKPFEGKLRETSLMHNTGEGLVAGPRLLAIFSRTFDQYEGLRQIGDLRGLPISNADILTNQAVSSCQRVMKLTLELFLRVLEHIGGVLVDARDRCLDNPSLPSSISPPTSSELVPTMSSPRSLKESSSLVPLKRGSPCLLSIPHVIERLETLSSNLLREYISFKEALLGLSGCLSSLLHISYPQLEKEDSLDEAQETDRKNQREKREEEFRVEGEKVVEGVIKEHLQRVEEVVSAVSTTLPTRIAKRIFHPYGGRIELLATTKEQLEGVRVWGAEWLEVQGKSLTQRELFGRSKSELLHRVEQSKQQLLLGLQALLENGLPESLSAVQNTLLYLESELLLYRNQLSSRLRQELKLVFDRTHKIFHRKKNISILSSPPPAQFPSTHTNEFFDLSFDPNEEKERQKEKEKEKEKKEKDVEKEWELEKDSEKEKENEMKEVGGTNVSAHTFPNDRDREKRMRRLREIRREKIVSDNL